MSNDWLSKIQKNQNRPARMQLGLNETRSPKEKEKNEQDIEYKTEHIKQPIQEHELAPEQASELDQEPAPKQAPKPDQALEQTPESDQEPAPEQASEPDQEPAPEQAPEPDQEPAPEQAPEPDQDPAPKQAPEPDQEPTPEQASEPDQEPAPEQATKPDQDPAPEQAPDPDLKQDQEKLIITINESDPEFEYLQLLKRGGQKRPKVEDTHIRRTYLMHHETLKLLEKIVDHTGMVNYEAVNLGIRQLAKLMDIK